MKRRDGQLQGRGVALLVPSEGSDGKRAKGSGQSFRNMVVETRQVCGSYSVDLLKARRTSSKEQLPPRELTKPTSCASILRTVVVQESAELRRLEWRLNQACLDGKPCRKTWMSQQRGIIVVELKRILFRLCRFELVIAACTVPHETSLLLIHIFTCFFFCTATS